MKSKSYLETKHRTAPGAMPTQHRRRHPVGAAIAGAGLVTAMLSTPVAASDFSALFSLKGQSVYRPGDAIDIDTNKRLGQIRSTSARNTARSSTPARSSAAF